MKHWSAFVLLTFLLAGCAANQGHLGNRSLDQVRPFSVRYDANGNQILEKRFANDQMNEQNRKDGRRLNSNNIVGKHDNYRIEMSEPIAEALKDKFGYADAHVVLTDHNAYVGVNSGSEGSLTSKSASLGRTRASYLHPAGEGRRDGQTGANQTGTQLRTDGMYDARNNGIYDPRPNADGGRPNADAGSVRAAGVEEHLTDEQKAAIAAEVKKMKPSVQHVYVSGKSDFVSRLAGYSADQSSGQPIQGYLAEFNAMAERIFPYEPHELTVKSKGLTSHIYD